MSSVDILHRLQRLEDVKAIEQLKNSYLRACDAKDPVQMRTCFPDDPVHIDYGPIGCFTSADALVKIYAETGCETYMQHMHHGCNSDIEWIDKENAHGIWSLYFQSIDTKDAKLTQLGGYYTDVYKKVGEKWKITSTIFTRTSAMILKLTPEVVQTVSLGLDV